MTCRSGCACLMYPFAVYKTRCFAHEHVAVWEVLYHAISAMYVTTLQTTNTTVVSGPVGCIMIHNTAYTTVGPQLCSCLFVLSMWISEDSTCIFVRGKGLHGAVALTILRSGVRVGASQEKGYRYPRCLENGFICSMGYRSDQLGNTVSARPSDESFRLPVLDPDVKFCLFFCRTMACQPFSNQSHESIFRG